VIALIDYGAGNLTSVRKALTALGADFAIPARPEECARFSAVIVPGVGNFAATSALVGPWRDAIGAAVRGGTPLFGICLGMQWLFEGSEEAPDCAGLGLLAGQCYRLHPSAPSGQGPSDAAERIKIPHVGWNAIELRRDASIVEGVPSGAQVYFTHSFVAPVTGDTVAVTDHGEPFAAIVQRGHVAGVQFHPEKSGEVGLTILRNFVELVG